MSSSRSVSVSRGCYDRIDRYCRDRGLPMSSVVDLLTRPECLAQLSQRLQERRASPEAVQAANVAPGAAGELVEAAAPTHAHAHAPGLSKTVAIPVPTWLLEACEDMAARGTLTVPQVFEAAVNRMLDAVTAEPSLLRDSGRCSLCDRWSSELTLTECKRCRELAPRSGAYGFAEPAQPTVGVTARKRGR